MRFIEIKDSAGDKILINVANITTVEKDYSKDDAVLISFIGGQQQTTSTQYGIIRELLKQKATK